MVIIIFDFDPYFFVLSVKIEIWLFGKYFFIDAFAAGWNNSNKSLGHSFFISFHFSADLYLRELFP